MTEVISQVIASPHSGGAAAQILAMLELGEVDGPLKINAELAEQMPFAEAVEGWCVGQIRVHGGIWAEDARRVWDEAKAKADPALREVAAEAVRDWIADQVALEGKETLVGLAQRLAALKPKIEAPAKAKPTLAELMATVEAKRIAAQPKTEEVEEPEEPELELEGGAAPWVAPGLVGELAEFAMRASMYPSQKFAVNMAMSVTGTLIGRRIAGPSGAIGTGTHSYRGIIGPSSFGKEIMRTVSKAVLAAVGAGALIGPGGFKSGPGVVKHLKKKPLSLCVMDEFGSSLAAYSEVQAAPYVREITKVLREIWGLSWSRYDSEEGARDNSEFIMSPALSILAMAVPTEFYGACRSTDVINGFLNRWTFVEEKIRAPEQQVAENALELPKGLREGLARLYRPHSMLDQSISDTGKPQFRLAWGPGAEEVYRAIKEKVESDTDERRRVLFSRAPEKAARDATILAAGCLDKFALRKYIELTSEWTLASDESLWAGFLEYGDEEKLDFSNLCREILRRIRRNNGKMTMRELRRSFQNNLKRKYDLDSALDQLVESGQLIEDKMPPEGGIGRPSISYSLVAWAEGDGEVA